MAEVRRQSPHHDLIHEIIQRIKTEKIFRMVVGMSIIFIILLIAGAFFHFGAESDVLVIMGGNTYLHSFGAAWATSLGMVGESVFLQSTNMSTRIITIILQTFVVLVGIWLL